MSASAARSSLDDLAVGAAARAHRRGGGGGRRRHDDRLARRLDGAELGADVLHLRRHRLVVLELRLSQLEELDAELGGHRHIELVEGRGGDLGEERLLVVELRELHLGAVRVVGEEGGRLPVELVHL